MKRVELVDEYRQNIINRVTAKLVQQEHTEQEALSLFIWNLQEMEPPVSCEEQLRFCANFRMFKSYCRTVVNSREKAVDILEIAPNKRGLPMKKLRQEAKVIYWRQYNSMTRNSRHFQINASVLGAKKKALYFLCNNLSKNT